MPLSKYLLPLALSGSALFSLAACEPTGTSHVSAPPSDPSNYVVGGLAPPAGRTATARQARRDYYQGPRGDEF